MSITLPPPLVKLLWPLTHTLIPITSSPPIYAYCSNLLSHILSSYTHSAGLNVFSPARSISLSRPLGQTV